eukprot:gene2440-3010_t
MFHHEEYLVCHSIRLNNKDIVNHSSQELCLLGRLSFVSITIKKEKDIRILDYIKGSSTIRTIHLYIDTPVRIPKGSIPGTVEELLVEGPSRLSNSFEVGTIPSSVKCLAIDHPLIKSVADRDLIPDLVEELRLGLWSYTPGETDILPPKIKKIIISSANEESAKLGALPQSITDLTVLFHLMEPIPRGALPESVTSLSFSEISCPLEIGLLPSKLEKLQVFSSFSPKEIIPAKGIIPESIKELYFEWATSDFNIDLIPKSSLTYLNINILDKDERSPLKNYNLKIDDPSQVQEFPKGLLPPSLKSLDIAYCSLSRFNVDDIHIPTNIQSIKFNNNYTSAEFLSKWIPKLLSQSKSRLQFICMGGIGMSLLSTDPSDQYIYYNLFSSINEGFISKSKIPLFLRKICKK